MKTSNILTTLIIIISLLLFSQTASAYTDASILYDETALSNGLWQYDYTFSNMSTNNEYLYGVQLYLGNSYEVSNTLKGGNWGGSWGMLSTTSFLETHSSNYANDIAANDSRSGFSFTVNSQIEGISYAAFFDEHNGSRSYSTGITASGAINNNPPLAPEPVSTVLFLTGGVTMAFRYRQKRKTQLS